MDLDSSDYTQVYSSYKHSKLMKYIFLAILFFSLLSIPFFKQSWQATYSVNANTGIVEISVHKKQNSWYLKDVNISIDSNNDQVKTGTLVVFKNTNIKFTAYNNGNVFVEISSNSVANTKGIIATFEDSLGGKIQTIKQSLGFLLTSNNGYNFPIQGQWKIGDVIHGQTSEENPILLNGQIRVYGNTFFSDGKFQAIEELLEAGDQMELKYNDARPSIGSGFVSMNEDYGMQVQYHAEADYADMNRFGSAGYKISPTIWHRLSNDPISVILFNIFITLAPFILIYIKIKGITQNNVSDTKKIKKKKDKQKLKTKKQKKSTDKS
ncbi:MAG: hypothetical protein L3J83_01065 [Proteobacteria bacterium]|nr:hypothetical protein [Pseudomonadota bacterium]